MLTLRDLAEEIGISLRTARRWADRGHVALLKTPSGRIRIEEAEIVRLKEQMRQRGQLATR